VHALPYAVPYLSAHCHSTYQHGAMYLTRPQGLLPWAFTAQHPRGLRACRIPVWGALLCAQPHEVLCGTDGAAARRRAEKTLNYCNCEANYTVTAPGGQELSSAGGCVQDSPDVAPWCPVVEATCSYRPPRRNGQAWDVCRGALPPGAAHWQAGRASDRA